MIKNKAFYNTLKSEIAKGQFLLSEMAAKIDVALAKGYLTFEEADELKTLAETSQDPTYKPLVTIEERFAEIDVELLNSKLCIADLGDMLFVIDDTVLALEDRIAVLEAKNDEVIA